MENLVSKITKIQNTQKSLGWGHHYHADNEVLFVVGHREYKKQLHYFTVNDSFEISFLTDNHKKELFKKCENQEEVVRIIIGLLKEWFPAKGNTE